MNINIQSRFGTTETAPRSREEEFDQAVDRVYMRYGPDLTEFIRAVQRGISKHAGAQDNQVQLNELRKE